MDKKAKIATISAFVVVLIVSIAIAVAAPRAQKECNDGLDNDGDTTIDYPADAGCSSKQDNDETNCGDGVCEGGETVETCAADCAIYTCTDTDGGIVINVKGIVSGIYYQTPYSYTDYCNSPGNATNVSVTEYYCRTDNKPTSSAYSCTNGCSDGACY